MLKFNETRFHHVHANSPWYFFFYMPDSAKFVLERVFGDYGQIYLKTPNLDYSASATCSAVQPKLKKLMFKRELESPLNSSNSNWALKVYRRTFSCSRWSRLNETATLFVCNMTADCNAWPEDVCEFNLKVSLLSQFLWNFFSAVITSEISWVPFLARRNRHCATEYLNSV